MPDYTTLYGSKFAPSVYNYFGFTFYLILVQAFLSIENDPPVCKYSVIFDFMSSTVLRTLFAD